MVHELHCPACGRPHLNLCDYDSMMVLSPHLALFSLRCPSCGTKIATMRPIPDVLRDVVRCAAREVSAGMGKE